MVIGTDCIGSYKSSYHKITTTSALPFVLKLVTTCDTFYQNTTLVLFDSNNCIKSANNKICQIKTVNVEKKKNKKKKITSDLNTFVKHSTSKGGWVIFLGSIFVLLIGVIYLCLFVI